MYPKEKSEAKKTSSSKTRSVIATVEGTVQLVQHKCTNHKAFRLISGQVCVSVCFIAPKLITLKAPVNLDDCALFLLPTLTCHHVITTIHYCKHINYLIILEFIGNLYMWLSFYLLRSNIIIIFIVFIDLLLESTYMVTVITPFKVVLV